MKIGLRLAAVLLTLSLLVGGLACRPKPALPASAPAPPSAPAATSPSAPTPAAPLPNYYENNIFGFKVGYPEDWQTRETGDFSPAVVIAPAGEDPTFLAVSVSYGNEILAADKVADGLMADILTQPGAKVIAEKEIKLGETATAFEITFSLGRGGDERRGVLLVATRGSQVIFVTLLAARVAFEEKSADFLSYVRSLRLEEPRPFGISRRESLTLFFAEPSTLDPAQATESLSVQYVTQIFSGLMSFTPNLELVPDLAEKYQVSADGKVYTFSLRTSARFHDGRQVTADDIKYSWERAARSSPDTALTYLGDIIGVKEMATGKATEIRGVKVIDKRTLQVTIDAAKAYFLAKLTHPVAFTVDRANVTGGGDQWWQKPNGTGPFRLKGWQPGIILALERNPDYHRTPAAIPYIVFRHLGVSPLRLYQTGEVDIAFPMIEELAEIRQPANPLAKELKDVAQLSISFVGFNTKKPPFDDAAVRRSFLLAVDRERLIKEVLKEEVQIAHGFMPPGLPAYNPDLTPIPFDPTEARRLLASYGKTLPTITFVTPGYTTISPITQALIDMWRDNLGIRVEVKLVAPDTYYYDLATEMESLYNYGWIADYPDPENFLDVLFHSQMGNNVGKYTNSRVDQLLEKARVEPNRQTRFQWYQEVEETLRQEAAAIPLSFGRESVLIKPSVKGFAINPQGLVEFRLVSFTSSD